MTQTRDLSNQLKRLNITIEIIIAILLIVLFYTAISKLIDRLSFVTNLQQHSIFSEYAGLVSYAVPVTELLIASMLVFTKLRRIALAASFILMASFTVYVIHLMSTNPDLPCSCGGAVSWLSWPQHIAFNIFLTTISGLGFWLLKKQQVIHKFLIAR